MLLSRLSSDMGLACLGRGPSNQELEVIEAFNRSIEKQVHISSPDTASNIAFLKIIFGIRLGAHFNSSSDQLIMLYATKIADYVCSRSCLSDAHLQTRGCANNSDRPHGHVWEYCQLDMSRYSSRLEPLVGPILSSMVKMYKSGDPFPSIDLGGSSNLSTAIKEILVENMDKGVSNVIGLCDSVVHLFVAGQAKLHPPNSLPTSIDWHLDGDPRYSKILIYLNDVASNDGSFQVSPWRNCIGSGIADHFSLVSLMIPLEYKKNATANCVEYLGLLGYLLISDICFLAYKSFNPYKSGITIPVRKYSSVLFNGTIMPHKGGNNTCCFRPVLQCLVSRV